MHVNITRRLFLQLGVAAGLHSPTSLLNPVDIQKRVDRCSQGGGGEITLPAGTAVFDQSLIVRPGVILRGAGCGLTILRAAKTGMPVIDLHSRGAPVGTGGLEDLTVWGWGDRVPNVGGESDRAVRIGPFQNGHVRNVEIAWSRYMSLTAYGTVFTVENSHIHHGFRDGINMNSVDHGVIRNNLVEFVADDGISSHIGARISGKVDRSITISGNTVRKCSGIKVLGARNALIENNKISEVYGYAVCLGADSHFHEGEAPEHDVVIRNNLISDTIGLKAINSQDGVAAIYIRNYPVQADSSDVSIDTVDHSGRLAESKRISIFGNVLSQNITRAGRAADIGLGTLWWTTGYLNPAVDTDIALLGGSTMRGIMVQNGAWKDLDIRNNVLSGFTAGILLQQVDSFDECKIDSNTISRCGDGIVIDMKTVTKVDLEIVKNSFDLDPLREAKSRLPTGEWRPGSPWPRCAALVYHNAVGVTQKQNTFKNMSAEMVNA